MNKKLFLLAFLSGLLTVLNINTAQAENHFSLFLGEKSLDSYEWEPVENQSEIGFLFDFEMNSSINIAIDYLSSEDTDSFSYITITGETTELDIGVRKYFEQENEKLRPYLGGGIAFISATVSATNGYNSASESDSGTGIWINAGIQFDVNDDFYVGAEIRSSSADVTLFNTTVDAGGSHIGVLAGLSF